MRMILRCVLFVLLLVLSLYPLSAAELNVMSFNIRYDNPRDGQNNWRFRVDHVVGMFSHHDVAVAGLQEVLHRQLNALTERLPNYQFVGVGREDGRQKGEYSPIFFRKDLLVLEKNETIWLSKTPTKAGSKSWDSSLPRIATLAWFKETKGGQRWLIVNTHFDHRGAVARRESASLIARHVRKVNLQKLPVVVMGDLNCLAGSEPYQAFQQGGLQDALPRTETKHQGPLSSWNGFGKAVVAKRRIDFVFTSPNLKILRHKIDDRQFKGRFPSDHCPVIVRVAQP